MAAIWVEFTTTTFDAVFAPKFTAVAPVKFVPVIVTEVPPTVDPEEGLTPVTVGPRPTPYGLEATELA